MGRGHLHSTGTQRKRQWLEKGHRGRAGTLTGARGRRRREHESTVLRGEETCGLPRATEVHGSPGVGRHDRTLWMRKGRVQGALPIRLCSTSACCGRTDVRPVPNPNKRSPQQSRAQRCFKTLQCAYRGISIKISLPFFLPCSLSMLPAISQPHGNGVRGRRHGMRSVRLFLKIDFIF